MNGIYDKIYQLAYKLENANEHYTRAELAYELNITPDSIAVSKLVWEAYIAKKNAECIKTAFLENDGKTSIVQEYSLHYLLEAKKEDVLFQNISTKLQDGSALLNELSQLTAIELTPEQRRAVSTIRNTIVGTKGVVDVQSEAGVLFEKYTQLTDSYDETKYNIKSLISDFTYLRGGIHKTFITYTTHLIDIFGDSIEVVAPELFDFESIEWLDISSLFKQAELQYNKLSEHCGELMASISSDFTKSLNNSANSFNLTKSCGKGFGIFVAGLSLLEHYANVEAQVAELKKQLLFLKGNMKKDSTAIKADYARLLTIYKLLNDLLLPKAEVFYRNSNRILSGEYKNLLNSLYNNSKLRALNLEREEILKTYQEIENTIIDAQLNISTFTEKINDTNDILDSYSLKYKEAKYNQPSKPFFLFNILSFGYLGKGYNRNIYEWNQSYGKVVKEYEMLQVDLKMDSEDIKSFKSILQKKSSTLRQQKQKLDAINKKIRAQIVVDADAKVAVLNHLKPILTLLVLAKEITSYQLDPQLQHTVHVELEADLQLPTELTNRLNKFAYEVRKDLTVSEEDSAKLVKEYGNDREVKIDKETLHHINERQNSAVQSIAVAFEKMAELSLLKRQGAVLDRKYDAKLKAIQSDFQKTMHQIDNQSAVLRAAITKINLTNDKELVKDVLTSLTAVTYTDQELTEFIKGNLTIKI